MEFTKGEWRVEDRWNVLSGKRVIANCGGYSSNVEPVAEENEANARLIAQAPKLYEALRVAQAFITEGTKPQREKALIIISQAIASVEEK